LLNKPRALSAGATIGIIAPASLPTDLSAIDRGIATLESRGYRIKRFRERFERFGFLAGPDELRIEEINSMLADPEVDAIVCVRGGYGTLRILPHIDYDAARANPKLLVGYSDITALHLALLSQANVPGLSGPMVAVEWGEPDEPSEELFWALTHGGGIGDLVHPSTEPLAPVKQGIAEGPLIGGNLSLITRLIGTRFMPDLNGAILFIEEVGEEPYRIDGLMAHLKLSGVLDRIAGLVVGGITEWEPEHDRPTLSLDDVLDHYLSPMEIPVARGLAYGHFPVKHAMPIGVRARLRVDNETASLSLLEGVVEAG
jgi:muramoyltetrapeptide carboxypeptidase